MSSNKCFYSTLLRNLSYSFVVYVPAVTGNDDMLSYCFYCDEKHKSHNLARHMKRKHATEELVETCFKSEDTRKAMRLLRNKGNHK
jgi:hypothetical protein